MQKQLSQRKATKPSTTNAKDFTTVSQFLGYRHKEDQTNLPSGYLVVGSQNVLTNTGGRIGIRKGYVRDGQVNTTIAGIKSSFDWNRHVGDERHLRAGGLVVDATTGVVITAGKLQYRFFYPLASSWMGTAIPANTPYWIDLATGLSSVSYNFTDYWDSTGVRSLLLYVNGGSNITEWTGGVTTIKATTVNTITKTDATPLGTSPSQEGFYNAGSLVINGNTYTYAAVSATQFTGVLPDPTGEVNGSVVHQLPITTTNAAMTDIPATFKNDLISNLRNQIYVGSFTNNTTYISKVDNYKVYTVTSPVRLVGEGAKVTTDGSPNAFVPQEDKMYLSVGKDQWYQTQFILSADLAAESFMVTRLKTSVLQAARSQAAVSKTKNDVLFLNFETSFDSLGRVLNIQATPQSENISDPIKLDFDSYDFTDASVFYHRYYDYVAVPREGKVLIWNIAKGWWEAPQVLPISRFAVIDGQLYGHSSQVPETYRLFTGYNDNGSPIDARALFSFENYGTRSQTKYFNEFWVEGYISSNTTLNLGIKYDLDGCATNKSFSLVGDDTQFVCVRGAGNSLGKVSLGKYPLGGLIDVFGPNDLPPWFHWIPTTPRADFYEAQYAFSSNGVDFQWELLAFGPLVTRTTYGNNAIKD